ncbi:hypothetical protein EDD18DRAFT_1361280 [Armillaria luteobubalina]|uniref:Uncharacterized protein n=1 Tax=Armillaria luteobubalina TaxID=153913 RepID=A0AA39PJB8_9AGAR|nr:hypothetical protein EDD18DRAFT_1361280 [Armillaria luteobubalina]
MLIPDDKLPSATLSGHSSLPNWTQINLGEETDARIHRIQGIIRGVPSPWKTTSLISPAVDIMVMDVLQQELDVTSLPDVYCSVCMKCLQALSKDRNIVPSSLSCQEVTREGTNAICGGGFSDIWKGRLHDIQVCLKVLWMFEPEVKAVQVSPCNLWAELHLKRLQDFCQEALVWRLVLPRLDYA